MKLLINLIMIVVIGFFYCSVGIRSLDAKSVYSITDHHASTLRAYKIVGDQLEYQADVNVTHYAYGAVGLALAPDSEIMFVTYEGSNIIEMLNARTMISEENPLTVPGASNLAGIAVKAAGKGLNKTGDFYIMVYIA